ncbi:MAG: type III pantothenate kinase [Sedimenticolaceae bacterium]
MTALLVDLGNTRWKITHTEGAAIGRVVDGSYDDLGRLRAAALGDADRVDAIWLASVVDAHTTGLVSTTLQQALGTAVHDVKSTDPMPGLVSGYRKPEQLGIDRLLAMVAARARVPQALCVVVAGTAVTVDFVDPDGQHLGGFILPGRRMFRECLLTNTSIPRDTKVDERAVLGCDTPTAVALAGRYAVVGIVERFVAGPKSLFPGQRVNIFAGGGDADDLMELLPPPCTKLDHLVLRGLAVIAAGGDS